MAGKGIESDAVFLKTQQRFRRDQRDCRSQIRRFGVADAEFRHFADDGGFSDVSERIGAKNKVGFCFGSYGWKKDAQSEMQDVLAKLGWMLPEPIAVLNWRPTPEGLKQLHETAMKVVEQ